MRKNILTVSYIIIFISIINASDIPFFKSFFMSDEEYVRQEILKCKDVESVELKLGYHDEDDKNYRIFIYLKDNRFISFADVQLYCFLSDNSIHDVRIKLVQINDLVFEQQSFEPHKLGKTNFVYHDWTTFGEIWFLEQLSPCLKTGNMLEIIENIDNVYDFIKNLPEKPESFSTKKTEFDGFYEKPFELPEEFDNGIPVSIINKKTDVATGKWYEKGYKFYKIPVERAIREATFQYAYKDYRTDY